MGGKGSGKPKPLWRFVTASGRDIRGGRGSETAERRRKMHGKRIQSNIDTLTHIARSGPVFRDQASYGKLAMGLKYWRNKKNF